MTNALWLIMDPWLEQPGGDTELSPNINKKNHETANKIALYLQDITHVRVSMDESHKIQPSLCHFVNIGYNVETLKQYMDNNNLNNIVYCGFHYGICIVNRPTGIRAMSQFYKLWVKKDLCGYFLKHCYQSQEKFISHADTLTTQYAIIV